MPKHHVQPPAWIDAAPIRVVATIEIAAPPSTVWAHIADHESWPKWFTTLDRVEVIGRRSGVGGGRRVYVKRLSIDEEFTVWDVDEHFAFAVVASKLPILHTLAESVRLEPIDGGTLVTYRQGLRAHAGVGWLLRLVWKPAERGLPVSLAKLRELVESAEG